MVLRPDLKVLYGSQTGNSEDVAERVGRYLSRCGCKTYVINLKDYHTANLAADTIVVFVCSTTGDGEVPDDMKPFWRFLLRKGLPSNSLCNLQFSVFGLGDSTYDKFNVTAKKLNKRLLQLGGSELLPLTLANDQHDLGYDAAYDPWIVALKSKLSEIFDLSEIISELLLPPRFSVEFVNSLQHKLPASKNAHSSLKAGVIENSRITSPDHFQAVHLVKFMMPDDVYYSPGDVAVVWPENPDEAVDEFLSLFDVPPDKHFILTPPDSNVVLPKLSQYPCTVRHCVKSYLDILSVPKRSFFEFFCLFSKDETEKEKLLEFTTAEGQEELYNYCNRPKRTILEVMQDFPHTTPGVPFEYLFDMIPSIHPRKFSIASATSFFPSEFHLAVAVVEYRTRLKIPRLGLCSNWLTKLSTGTKISFNIEKGSIQLPKKNCSIIMVGPGTGCAPFRSFIQERICQNNRENYLFFGCRFKEKDFLFSSDWEDYVKRGYLTIFTAFSREQEDKCYVQHSIRENGKIVFDLIVNRESHVYVAGNAKQMPDGVKSAFAEVIEAEGGFEKGYGLKFVQSLINNKRYCQETWA